MEGEVVGVAEALAQGEASTEAHALSSALALGDTADERLCACVLDAAGELEAVGVELVGAEAVAVAEALPCTRTCVKSGSVGASASVMGLVASAEKCSGAVPPPASKVASPAKVCGSIWYRDRAEVQGRVALYCCRLAPAVAPAPALRLRASTSGAAAPAL